MPDDNDRASWQVKEVHSGLSGLRKWAKSAGLPTFNIFPWNTQRISPADISNYLRDVMLNRENMIEDANFQKVVPNFFIVEVGQVNFKRQYQPILEQIISQWMGQLLEDLVTANRRRGRKEYRLGGRLHFEVKPADDLKDDEARIYSRVEQQGSQIKSIFPERTKNYTVVSASLELIPTGQHWALFPGINTIGRSAICQIFIDTPIVQEKRLVSGYHAYILMEREICVLFDGSPGGRPSANGTFVNLQKVEPGGKLLQHGDVIILAAADPSHPRADTPGVVCFKFLLERRGV